MSKTLNINAPAWVKDTFQSGTYRAKELKGPLQLIRLVNSQFYTAGSQKNVPSFWMRAPLFESMRRTAEKELRNQGIRDRDGLVGIHMRFQLRDKLAVCGNWSPLDSFIRLNLPKGSSVIAFVGKVKGQPYYDPSDKYDPDAKAKSQQASAGGIALPGGAIQVVIDFSLPENRAMKRHISGPFTF